MIEHAIAPSDKTREDCIWNLLTNPRSKWGLTQAYSKDKIPEKKIYREYLVQSRREIITFRNLSQMCRWLGCAERRFYGMAIGQKKEIRLRGRTYTITLQQRTAMEVNL